MQSRPYKFERVLTRAKGCDTCTWVPSTEIWETVCEQCKDITCGYCYDRGLSKVHLFRKQGITCYVPQKKQGKEQMVWTEVSTAQDRELAYERTNVERNNRELRAFAGFNCEITTGEISLAAAEGFAAAGLCNLKPQLQDRTQLTATSITTTKQLTATSIITTKERALRVIVIDGDHVACVCVRAFVWALREDDGSYLH